MLLGLEESAACSGSVLREPLMPLAMIAVYSGTSNQVEVSRVNGSDEIRLDLSAQSEACTTFRKPTRCVSAGLAAPDATSASAAASLERPHVFLTVSATAVRLMSRVSARHANAILIDP